MEEQKFEGEGWGKIGKIKVVEGNGKKQVFVRGKSYMVWQSNDEASQRMAMVQLINSHIGNVDELCEAFGVSKQTIYTQLSSYAQDGVSGLISERSGPRERWKITRRVRAKILIEALKEGMREYGMIQRRLAEIWNIEVSIGSIRQVLIENGLVREGRVEVEGIAEQIEIFDKTEQQGENQLGFNWEAKKRKEEIKEEKEGCGEVRVEGLEELLNEWKKERRGYSRGQREYLDRLEEGYYNTYAGGLLFVPLLEKYSFLKTLKDVVDMKIQEGYSMEELCLTLFYYDMFEFKSMEDFKRAYAEEFGMLIGRGTSPSLFTLRRYLHKVREMEKGEAFMKAFAKEYLKSGIARWGVLYIDGHFLPYYGMYLISKGWHTVRQMPMKGSYNFLGVDGHFMPWMFLIRSSREDLLEKIPEMIEDAKEMGQEIGIRKKDVEKLIVLFDREGYSAKLFRYLDGKDGGANSKRKAIFISWAKYVDKWVNEILPGEFNGRVKVHYEIQKAEEVMYCERERVMNKYGKIRAIVIESGIKKKRMAIYTNGKIDEISTEEVIKLMCRRWGEENSIKELLLKHKINYMPGYVIEQSTEQPMVKNPKIKKLKKEKAKKTIELNKLRGQLTKEVVDRKKGWDEILAEQTEVLGEVSKIEDEILFINHEISDLPKEVRFDEAYDGKRLLELDYEKKRFLDCIKVCVYNVEKKMSEMLLKYYDNKKEIWPALSMIVRRGGYVKLESGILKVRLKKFMNREINCAARCLCEELNKMRPVTLDKFRFPIVYEVT